MRIRQKTLTPMLTGMGLCICWEPYRHVWALHPINTWRDFDTVVVNGEKFCCWFHSLEDVFKFLVFHDGQMTFEQNYKPSYLT